MMDMCLSTFQVQSGARGGRIMMFKVTTVMGLKPMWLLMCSLWSAKNSVGAGEEVVRSIESICQQANCSVQEFLAFYFC